MREREIDEWQEEKMEMMQTSDLFTNTTEATEIT